MKHTVFILLTVQLIRGKGDFGNQFSRTHIGVTFSPYIETPKYEHDLSIFHPNKTGDVEKMLEVISTKFSRVMVDPDGLEAVIPANKSTLDSIVLRTAIGAAKFNAARNKTILRVFLGLGAYTVSSNEELYAAIQISQVANTMHNKTVEGLVFTGMHFETIEWVASAIAYTTAVRHLTKNLLIGSLLTCENLMPETFRKLNYYKKQMTKLVTQLLNASDFVICKFFPHAKHSQHGAKFTFSKYRHVLLRTRYLVQQYNPNIDVHGITAWHSDGAFPWKTVKEFVIYWNEVNKFAVSYNFSMWLREAFDIQWSTLSRNYTYMSNTGWWKWQNGVDHKEKHGEFVEKYSEFYLNTLKIANSQWNLSSEPSNTQSSLNTLAYVGVGFGFAALVVVIAFVAILKGRYVNLRNSLPKREITDFVYGAYGKRIGSQDQNELCINAMAFQMPYEESVEVAKDAFEITNEVLGEGEFGCVYKACLKTECGSIDVALKVAKGLNGLKGIMSEIKVLTFLGRHQNVVSLCGAYTKEVGDGIVYMGLEHCKGGCLRDYLKELKKSMAGDLISSALYRDLLRWSLEICQGLVHLKNKNVVHGDLAARNKTKFGISNISPTILQKKPFILSGNILLSGDRVAKITDFGLSRKLYDNLLYKKKQLGPLPWRWMAIESLKKSEFSQQSDIWGYGIVLWEIHSLGDQPFPSYAWS